MKILTFAILQKENNKDFKKASKPEIEKRIKIVVDNVHELAKLLLKCAKGQVKGEPTMKLGLSEISFYVYLKYY